MDKIDKERDIVVADYINSEISQSLINKHQNLPPLKHFSDIYRSIEEKFDSSKNESTISGRR